MTQPRPDLSERLGVMYRRIPVLAIGQDVYCDSSLITAVIERQFPASAGFGTIFPRRTGGGKGDSGVPKALAMTYADRTVGPFASLLQPYHKFKKDFVEDRSNVRPSQGF